MPDDNRPLLGGASVPAMASQGRGGSQSFLPADFGGAMELGALMARGGPAVPKHLRQNPAMCLSVVWVASQVGMNPFLLAGDTYVVNDILAFGAKSMVALVNQSRILKGRLSYDLSGEWPKRVCKVTGILADDNKPRELSIFAETITTRNSPLWRQQRDVQLMYYSGRAWARLFAPEILLGMVGDDEVMDGGALVEQPDGTYAAERPARPSRAAVGRMVTEPETPYSGPDYGVEPPAAAPAPAAAPMPANDPPAPDPEPESDGDVTLWPVYDEFGEQVEEFQSQGHAAGWVIGQIEEARGEKKAKRVVGIATANEALIDSLPDGPQLKAIKDGVKAAKAAITRAENATAKTEDQGEAPPNPTPPTNDAPADPAPPAELELAIPAPGEAERDRRGWGAWMTKFVETGAKFFAEGGPVRAFVDANKPTLDALEAEFPTWAESMALRCNSWGAPWK